jgi:LysR family cys regulon transcriptional activator
LRDCKAQGPHHLGRRRLHTNQPGISKQLKLLEEELGVTIFGPSSNRLVDITAECQRVVVRARSILREVGSIRTIGRERMLDNSGPLPKPVCEVFRPTRS